METEKTFKDLLVGYRVFRDKYTTGDNSIMRTLSVQGQKPRFMLVACCDSRVDPAVIMQCDPGDLFVIRNLANIIPPYEKDEALHGTSAALEFGICHLNVCELILLGHSQCAGIRALLKNKNLQQNEFIKKWVSSVKMTQTELNDLQCPDEYAKLALNRSYENCLTFPWIKEKINERKLTIHRWFFDIESGKIFTYSDNYQLYQALD